MNRKFLKLIAVARTATYIKGAVGFATAIIAKIAMAIPSPELAVTATFVRFGAALLLMVLAMRLNRSRKRPHKVENWILAGLAAGAMAALGADVCCWLAKFVFVLVAVVAYKAFGKK